MFTNLSYQDKQAFFGLLDEYFASRPNLLSGSGDSAGANGQQSPIAQLQTLGRFLSPPPSAGPTGRNADGSAMTEEELLKEAKDKEAEAKRVEMVTKYAQKGIKHGTAGARSGIGMVSRNATAMGALDKYGAGGLVRGADFMLGKKPDANANAAQAQAQNGSGLPSPPPEKKKGGGVSGLVSGKSFGHVDTSSKMGAFTSMWKDPQKAQAPTANTYQPPSFQSSHTALPPPTRRAGGSGGVPTQTTQAASADGQAQVLYDYSGADSGDLSIQTGQIVNVLEKTSDDWWTCEDGNGKQGLVPANYLKEV